MSFLLVYGKNNLHTGQSWDEGDILFLKEDDTSGRNLLFGRVFQHIILLRDVLLREDFLDSVMPRLRGLPKGGVYTIHTANEKQKETLKKYFLRKKS